MHPNPMRLTFRPDRPKRVYFMSQPPCGPDPTSHSNHTPAYDPGSTAARSVPAITLEGTTPRSGPHALIAPDERRSTPGTNRFGPQPGTPSQIPPTGSLGHPSHYASSSSNPAPDATGMPGRGWRAVSDKHSSHGPW